MKHLPTSVPWSWRLFLLWASGLSAAGWVLSWFGQLNAQAYGGLLLLGTMGSVIWWRREHPEGWVMPSLWRRRSRWRRLLPGGFLVLAGLALLGGLLYVPNNIDALAYRTPRVLHWLAVGRWHWIECPYQRLNVRATGIEWLTAPILALTRSDRPLFLIQWLSFLMLPGFVFGALRDAGVSRVQSWRWMWLFPTAFCFVVQAGGIANDLYGAGVSAAAAALAWRARRAKGEAAADALRWSALAIALTTNAKASNVLLLLPWSLVVWPALRSCVRRPLLTGAVAVLAGIASFAPTAWHNWRQCGDWTGARAEFAWTQPPGPVTAVVHNTLLWSLQNLMPPINPGSGKFNVIFETILPEFWKAKLDTFAEGYRHAYCIQELPSEEYAGLGANLAWWLILGAVVRLRHRSGWQAYRRIPGPWIAVTLVAPWVAALIYATQSAIQPNGRILAPFYIWALPSLLVPVAREVLTPKWRRRAEWLTLGSAAIAVILSPGRPLFPAHLTARWETSRRTFSLLNRVAIVYRVYGERADGFAALRQHVPPDVKTLGFITGNDPETSLWRPYGSRRVQHVLPPYSRSEMDRLQVQWVVINLAELEGRSGTTLEAWLRNVDGELVHRQAFTVAAELEPWHYAVVRLRPRP